MRLLDFITLGLMFEKLFLQNRNHETKDTTRPIDNPPKAIPTISKSDSLILLSFDGDWVEFIEVNAEVDSIFKMDGIVLVLDVNENELFVSSVTRISISVDNSIGLFEVIFSFTPSSVVEENDKLYDVELIEDSVELIAVGLFEL